MAFIVEIGGMIRAFRTQKKLTLKHLAEKAGISAPYLSQIENNQVNMNMSVLESLAEALEVPIYMFFIQEKVNDISLVEAAKRPSTLRDDGVRVEQLMNQPFFQDNIIVMNLPKGHEAAEYSAHQGNEFIFMLEGSAQVDFSGYRTVALFEGDSLAFSSQIPHRLLSQMGAKLLLRSSIYRTPYL